MMVTDDPGWSPVRLLAYTLAKLYRDPKLAAYEAATSKTYSDMEDKDA